MSVSIKKENSIFFNHSFDKKRLKALISWVFKRSGEEEALRVLDLLKETGFRHATKAGISIGLHDLTTPIQKSWLISESQLAMNTTDRDFIGAKITATERSQRIIDTWHRASESLSKQVVDYFGIYDQFNPVYIMALSGARGNFSQVRQLIGMRGLMADQQGKIVNFPIRSNLREGLTLTEYFISCSGARKGLVDTALRTADTGYLTRRLVDVAHHVVVKRSRCNSNRGIAFKSLQSYNKVLLPLKERLVGRVLAEDIETPLSRLREQKRDGQKSSFALQLIAKKDEEISPKLSLKISQVREKVFIRSPLTCGFQHSVCQLCYGWSISQGSLVSLGDAVGVIAAQSIGEPGTQLTMRTFHTGGVFSGDLLQEIRAPHSGTIQFSKAFQGLLIRTAHGRIAFLSKTKGSLILSNGCHSSILSLPNSELQDNFPAQQSKFYRANKGTTIKKDTYFTEIPIQAFTMLFVRQGERVENNQLLAEFSIQSKEGNQPIKTQQTIFAELSGRIIEDRSGKVYTKSIKESCVSLSTPCRASSFLGTQIQDIDGLPCLRSVASKNRSFQVLRSKTKFCLAKSCACAYVPLWGKEGVQSAVPCPFTFALQIFDLHRRFARVGASRGKEGVQSTAHAQKGVRTSSGTASIRRAYKSSCALPCPFTPLWGTRASRGTAHGKYLPCPVNVLARRRNPLVIGAKRGTIKREALLQGVLRVRTRGTAQHITAKQRISSYALCLALRTSALHTFVVLLKQSVLRVRATSSSLQIYDLHKKFASGVALCRALVLTPKVFEARCPFGAKKGLGQVGAQRTRHGIEARRFVRALVSKGVKAFFNKNYSLASREHNKEKHWSHVCKEPCAATEIRKKVFTNTSSFLENQIGNSQILSSLKNEDFENDVFKYIEPVKSGRLGFLKVIATRVGATLDYSSPIKPFDYNFIKRKRMQSSKIHTNCAVMPSTHALYKQSAVSCCAVPRALCPNTCTQCKSLICKGCEGEGAKRNVLRSKTLQTFAPTENKISTGCCTKAQSHFGTVREEQKRSKAGIRLTTDFAKGKQLQQSVHYLHPEYIKENRFFLQSIAEYGDIVDEVYKIKSQIF